MKSHSSLLLHILTLIYSWKTIARDAQEKSDTQSSITRSMCVCVDKAVMLCLIFVMFVNYYSLGWTIVCLRMYCIEILCRLLLHFFVLYVIIRICIFRVFYPLSRSNKRTLLNSNLRVILVFEYQKNPDILHIWIIFVYNIHLYKL